jgi:hypothetical protein
MEKKANTIDWDDSRTMAGMTRRILAWHDTATREQAQEGRDWYLKARELAGELALGYGYSGEQVAGCIAVLSPQVSWEKNVEAARAAVKLHAAGYRPETIPGYAGYRANVAKAWRALDGDMSAVKGPKVEAFAAAILADLSHVVVDVWAIRAARAPRRALALAWLDVEQDGVREKRAIAEAYRRAAVKRGIEPAEMQAIVWVAVRESEEWRRPRGERERARFYQKQARARIALGMPAMHAYWGNARKRRSYASAIGAGA